MKKNFFTTQLLLLGLYLVSLTSCIKDNEDITPIAEEKSDKISLKMTHNQAETYASIFSPVLNKKESLMKRNALRKAGRPFKDVSTTEKELENIDYLIEGKDTLLYAFNYKDDRGYILLSASNGTFPILAHSDKGNLFFDKIDKGSSLHFMIEMAANNVKQTLENPSSKNLEYFEKWKNLGDEGYEYEISMNNSEPNNGVPNIAGRRDYSNGKSSIYPATGYELDLWGQYGDYNNYADNGALIGCPAVAIGMLLHDVEHRYMGEFLTTVPSFDYYEPADAVGQKLRRIADSIPNYQWGSHWGDESGAYPSDIIKGLKKLGFKQAKIEPFEFDSFYDNLAYTKEGSAGELINFERGVLLFGRHADSPDSHIWFCDGYYEQSFTVRRKFLGIVIGTWHEYEDRYYMNWGWDSGELNGWFTYGYHWYSNEGTTPYTAHISMITNLKYYETPPYVYPNN